MFTKLVAIHDSKGLGCPAVNLLSLQLELFSVQSRREEYAPFLRFAWHPTYSELQGDLKGVLRVPELPLRVDLPEALKARIQLFAMHPFVNSAGVRFLPNMLAKDVLVKNFIEPEAGTEPPSTRESSSLFVSYLIFICG